MARISLPKAMWLITLFLNLSHAQTPSSEDSFAGLSLTSRNSRPRPSGRWISPEYEWFFENPLPIPPTKEPKFTWTDESTGHAIEYYEIVVKSFKEQIYPNLPATELVGYDGISPGPTFVMQRGREAIVRFTNDGPTEVSVHVHGQYNRAPFDGWAGDYSHPGQYKDYYYPNAQNARTIWYHDHTEFKTAKNAYSGQEAFYIITDAEEQSFGLPKGKYDVNLALGAKIYNFDGSLRYDTNNDFGLWGDIIQVNGKPWPYLAVEPRKYRFRLLNGAVSRTFALSLHQGLDGDALSFEAIASDGGLFSHPVNTDSIALSMGERYEIVVDFAAHKNQNITMRNLRGVGENIDYAATDLVMRFVVGESVSDDTNNGDVPSELRDISPAPQTDVVKDFTFARVGGEWLINGVGFSDVEHRVLTRPQRGEDEIWTLRNGNGNGTHPVHIHLVDFQVLSRTGGRNRVLEIESAGKKDVVWVAGGETIQVVARYAPWEGVYMFHCHNLIHEDHEMLVAFNVTQLEKWGYDNSTLFIDPMQPEFRPKDITDEAYTEEAIMSKIAWFYSTNAYSKGGAAGVSAALDVYSTGGARASISSADSLSEATTNTNAAFDTSLTEPSASMTDKLPTLSSTHTGLHPDSSTERD